MKLNDITHKDGSRSIQIKTACGFEILIMKGEAGELRQACYYNNSPVSLFNSHYRLSKEGALEYAQTLIEIQQPKE